VSHVPGGAHQSKVGLQTSLLRPFEARTWLGPRTQLLVRPNLGPDFCGSRRPSTHTRSPRAAMSPDIGANPTFSGSPWYPPASGPRATLKNCQASFTDFAPPIRLAAGTGASKTVHGRLPPPGNRASATTFSRVPLVIRAFSWSSSPWRGFPMTAHAIGRTHPT